MKAKSLPPNVAFAVPFTLYSINAKRAVQVRVRHDGFAYFMPQVHVGDHSGSQAASGDATRGSAAAKSQRETFAMGTSCDRQLPTSTLQRGSEGSLSVGRLP